MRESFRNGVILLLKTQRELGRPPAREKINKLVHKIVKEVGLRDDPRRSYFELLATCALMGRESMYYNFKPRRKHGSKKEV